MSTENERSKSIYSFSIVDNNPYSLNNQLSFNFLPDKAIDFSPNIKRSIYLMAISAVLFSITTVMCKILFIFYDNVDSDSIALFRGFSICIFSYYFASQENVDFKKEASEHKDKMVYLFFRCLIAVVGVILFTVSLLFIKTSSATTIFFVYPMMIAVLNGIKGIEPIHAKDYVMYVLCILGIACICKPDFLFSNESEDQSIGYLIVLVGAFLFACSIVMNSHTANYFHTHTICFYNGVLFILSYIILNPIAKKGSSIFDLTFETFILQIIQGGVNYFFMYSYILSIGNKAPKIIICLAYSSIVYSFILDSIVFGKRIQMLDIFGAMIIISINVFNIIKNS